MNDCVKCNGNSFSLCEVYYHWGTFFFSQSEIVSRLLEILSEDTEGFSRRAVVRYFISWFSSSASPSSPTSLLSRCVHTVLFRGSADLDWEVKVHTLELAELLLDEAFSAHHTSRKNPGSEPALSHPDGAVWDQALRPLAHTCTEDVQADLVAALNSAVELGVISVLLGGLVDCDRPVALKACQLLVTLRETLCPLSGGALDAVSCDLPERSWGTEVSRALRAANPDVGRRTGRADGAGDAEEQGGTGGAVSVCQLLAALRLDEKLDILSQSSDHVHNSALSLLQDILRADVAHTHPETQPGQEVIADCY